MISINGNPAANQAALNLYKTNSELESSLKKLSSGSRISRPSDDAGGLAVSMKMSSQELQLSGLEKNLANAQSYLETQEGALRILSKILTRISELESLKMDVTKNEGDLENYDKEMENLQAEIVKIREETFNGIRLFAPDSTPDAIQVDGFPLNNSVVDLVRPPLPTSFVTDPLEIVILADVSGSMDSYITEVKNGIGSLIDSLDKSNIKSWGIKVVGYPASAANISGANNPFITNTNPDPLNTLKSQFDSLPRYSVGQGEPLIEALNEVVNIPWSTNRDAKKAIFAFTDEEITTTNFASQNRHDVAKLIKDNGIDFNLLTEAHNDAWTNDLVNESGGVKSDLTDGLKDSNLFFSNYADSLVDDPFGLEELADYIAQNGASQSAIQHLAESVTITKNNLQQANSRIKDVDIASESTRLSRLQILQQAGSSMLSQANASQQTLIQLLQGQ